MTSRTAVCHCGDLTVECTGEPRRVSMCHCLDCQRSTGSAFSVAVFYARDQLRIGGGQSASFTRDSASGFAVTFHFCKRCGTSLWWEPARLPDLIGVALGGFADPDFPAPGQAVWVQDKHPWIGLPESMPKHSIAPRPR